MAQKQHGVMEDVAAEIGYTATTALVDWFGGIGQLYIPNEAKEDHPIAKVIGMPAFIRLVKMFEKAGVHERFVWMNQNEQREIVRRDRLIAAMMDMGLGSKQISMLTGMSESHVRWARKRVEEMGVLPILMRRAGLEYRGEKFVANAGVENQGQKSLSKTGVESQGRKPGVKAGCQNAPSKVAIKCRGGKRGW